jgi:thioredoxin reductase (NADPH)
MQYDLLIIGSGPAGLSAGIYAKRANLKVAIAEKEYEGTGQIAESGKVDNYPGLPGISGYELGEKFREHAISLGVEFIEKEVVKIEQTESDGEDSKRAYQLTFEDGSKEKSRTLIYAAGAYPKRGGIKGEEDFLGKGISYCAICDGAFCKGKTVAVLGGGDSALDDAFYLSELAEKVYLIHRRETFRGAAATLEKIKEKENVEILLKESALEITGEKKAEKLLLSSGKRLDINMVFIAYGSHPQTELVKDLVKLDEAAYIIAEENTKAYKLDGKTILEGFYAAGDVRRKELRQVSTAIADGANAATQAAEFIRAQGRA